MEIAIIGMSGRFPEAADLETFYHHLRNGRDSVRPLTLCRMRDTTIAPVKSYKHLAFLEDIDKFDYRFFDVVYSEAATMAPQQRLMLEMVYEAVEHAGYSPAALSGARTSVYIASNTPEYYKLAVEFTPTLLTGNLAACISGKIARYFNWTGAAVQIDTACSSSLVALHMACEDIRSGNSDLSVCGGINLFLFPPAEGRDAETGITSPTAKCRTFAATADGAGMGEGGACVLLKPLDKAMADKDNVLAVIKATAVNQDAMRSSTLTAPSSIAQEEVIVRAFEKAGIDPATISLIEAHGTGTPLGDPIEIEGLRMAFEKYTANKQFCAISALKSNIGHTDAAAGLLGVVKTVLALEKKELFPSLHVAAVSPMIDFMDSPLYLNTTLKPWNTNGEKRRAGVSAFGISGTNCHVILEEADRPVATRAEGVPYLFCISAKHPDALRRNCRALEAFIGAHPNASLGEISHTLNTGRTHFPFRVALVAASHETLLSQLKDIRIPEKPIPPVPDLWWLFSTSGQEGSALSETLRQAFPAYAQGYDQLADVLKDAAEATRFSIAAGYGFYTFFRALGIPVNQVVGVGTGKEIAGLVSGRKTLADFSLSPVDTVAPKWAEFVKVKLKSSSALVCEVGIGAAYYKQLLPYRDAAHPFEACNPGAGFSFSDILRFIGQLMTSGFNCNLQTLYAQPVAKIALPPYQFEPSPCWIRSAEDDVVKSWIHQLQWEETTADNNDVNQFDAFVVYAPEPASAALLTGLLREKGYRVTGVHHATDFAIQENGDIYFNWCHEPDYQQFEVAITSTDTRNITHIHLGACRQYGDIEAAFSHGLNAVMLLAKTLGKQAHRHQLVVVTDNATAITGEEPVLHPEAAALHGLLAGIRSDIPQLSAYGIDTDWEQLQQRGISVLLPLLLNTPEQLITGVRNGRYYARKLGTPVKQRPVVFQQDAPYLVTGGASGIGLQVLKAMSWSKAVFIVTGRRQFPHPDLWPFITASSHPEHFEAVQGFLQVISNGSKVVYYAADVTDAVKMRRIVERVSQQYGRIHGIIHAAGIGGQARIQRHTTDSFREALLPKVQGTLLLQALTAASKPDFFLLFSSHNVFVAAERESSYSAANAFLDSFAGSLHKEGVHGMTIRWPFWSETGMGFRMKPYDDFLIPPEISVTNEEGLAVFDHLLQQGYTDVLIAKTSADAATGALFRKGAANIPLTKYQPAVTTSSEVIIAEEFLLQTWKKVLSREVILPEDNFFQLGGHSLLGLQIRNQVEKHLRVKLEYRDIVECPTILSLGKRIRSLGNIADTHHHHIIPAPLADRYPPSEAQLGLWIVCQTAENKSAYNVSLGYEISGSIDTQALKQAVDQVMQQHEILRTYFLYEAETLCQVIAPVDGLAVPLEIRTDTAGTTTALELAGKHVFDLSVAPLFKIWLVKRGQDQHELIIVIHHIIVDGWSAHLFLQTLFHTYGLFIKGKTPVAAAASLQYKDYAVWEQQQLSGTAYDAHRKFWKLYLHQLPAALLLPLDYSRQVTGRGKGDCVRFELTAAHLSGFNRISRQEQVSKFLIGCTMLQLLLYRYTGQTDFFIGTPSSLRNQEALEEQLGYYVNMLPLRCQVSGTDSFYQLLHAAAASLKKVQEHQVFPFRQIVSTAENMYTAPGHHPLFDITFSYEHQQKDTTQTDFPGSIRELDLYTIHSKYDLEFVMRETADSIAVTIMYDTGLYTKHTVQQIAAHFIRLADTVTLSLSIDGFVLEDAQPQAVVTETASSDFNF